MRTEEFDWATNSMVILRRFAANDSPIIGE